MADITSFGIIALLTIASAVLIFIQKKIVHAILSLTAVFIMSAIIFLYLNQVFIALLQVFIFVGGLSTYLIVAIGAEQKPYKYFDIRVFLIAAVIITAGLSIILLSIGNSQTQNGMDFLSVSTSSLQNYYPVLFALVVLLASSAVGSVLFVKKFVKPVV